MARRVVEPAAPQGKGVDGIPGWRRSPIGRIAEPAHGFLPGWRFVQLKYTCLISINHRLVKSKTVMFRNGISPTCRLRIAPRGFGQARDYREYGAFSWNCHHSETGYPFSDRAPAFDGIREGVQQNLTALHRSMAPTMICIVIGPFKGLRKTCRGQQHPGAGVHHARAAGVTPRGCPQGARQERSESSRLTIHKAVLVGSDD
jgi:hypothetical protein